MSLPDFHDFRRGDVLRPFTLRVSAEEARAYLVATGESAATARLWEHTAPPLAVGALLLAGLMDEVPLPAGAVHIGQDFEFIHPIPLDAEVEVRMVIAQQSVRQGANVVVFGSELTSAGRVVMRGRTMVTAPATVSGAAK
jgi:hypothetical protein